MVLGGTEVTLAMPVLAGDASERVPPVSSDFQVGAELVPIGDMAGIEDATFVAYQRILERAGANVVCRIWNYVPIINAVTGGLEHYRSFCRGRARAFDAAWGSSSVERLPAASAVGGPDGALAIIYATAAQRPRSIENPTQVPAYHYPPEHGPRSPSFCRAACVTGASHDWVFVSGTASIKGHTTIAPGQLLPQIETTLDNLQRVSRACDLGSDLGASSGWQRHFKVYLRHARDLAVARQALEPVLLRDSDSRVWLQADICRADLEIEIEATLWRRR